MANTNTPFGLSPRKYLNGSDYNGQANMYYIASTDTNAFAIGDPVVLSGTGDGNGVAGVTLATAGTGNQVLGAIVGMGGIAYGGAGVDPSNPNTTVIPATKAKAYYVLVADDPHIVFACQDAGDGTPLAASNIGSNANLKSGTNSGYLSGWQITDSGLATTNTLQLQLLGLDQVAGNVFGAYAKWLVRIVNHQFNAGTAGV